LRRNPRLENAIPGASPSAFGSALRPVCSFSAHSQEMGVRSFEPVEDTWFASSHWRAQARGAGKLVVANTIMGAKVARSWTRACVVCSCRSRLVVRGSRCRPALSVGRRRDLAFGSLTPPSHRKGRRAKGSEVGSRAKTYEVTDRRRTRKGTKARS